MAEPPAFSPRILVVDDQPDFTGALRSVLQRLFPDAEIAVAGSGHAALEALTTAPSDLVLLDYRLPDLDGLEVLAEIRGQGLDVPVVMITGEGDQNVAADLFRLGAWDYLVKSQLDPRLVGATVSQVLERRRLERAVGGDGDTLVQRSLELDEQRRSLIAANTLLSERKQQLQSLSDDLDQKVRQRTAELRRTSAFLNQVLDSVVDTFLFAAAPDGTLLRFNAGALRAFGHELADRPDLRLDDLFDAHAAGPMLPRALGGSGFRQEVEAIRLDGRTFACRVDAAPIVDEGGRATGEGVVVVGSDITAELAAREAARHHLRSLEAANIALQHQNEQVREATRQRSWFVAQVSHELKTPLNAVLGYVDLLTAGVYGPTTDRQGEAIRGIEKRSRDLLAHINDLLDIAQVEVGRLQLHREAFRPGALMDEVMDLARVLIADRPIQVHCRVDATLGPVDTDRGKVRQVLFNLVSNAVRFTQQGSIVVRAWALPRGRFAISVADTGIGIAAQHRELIFDPFRQVEAGTSRAHGGTGLGLSISRSFARFLGGDLYVDSAPGLGSTFTLELPRVAAVAPRDGDPSEGPDTADGLPVDSVDDATLPRTPARR